MEKEILEKLEALEKRLVQLENGSEQPKEACCYTKNIEDMEVGTMEYVGNFKSEDGHTTSRFGYRPLSIADLLAIETTDITRIIEAFSSAERLNIVKILIQNQRSARELMEALNFSTTGKLYHHLSILENIGVIKKYGELYHVSARYISGILLILAGVHSILREDK